MIEELTKKLQSQLELFTVSIPGGVKVSNDDPEYSFKYVSEQFANMLGYATPKELLDASGGNIIGLAHPDDVEVGLADALNQYTHSDHYATIYRIRCKDGTYKYIEDRGQKVIKEDGTIEHWNLMLDKNDFMHKHESGKHRHKGQHQIPMLPTFQIGKKPIQPQHKHQDHVVVGTEILPAENDV